MPLHDESNMAASMPSSKWTAFVQSEGRKRAIHPPTSDNYEERTLDQLKLGCTARKLNVVKNIRKQERVELLRAWDTNKEAVQVPLVRQRKRSKRTCDEEEKRTAGCMFRLINVLFSDRFFESFLTTGNMLPREVLDDGGSTFWIDVASAFSSDTTEFDRLVSDDAVFEGVDASVHMAHSAAKLKIMWKEVSSNFARAEAGSKASGQGSDDFWDFCDGRADVFYLDWWCEHRQAGREFCAANVYSDDEDDSTQEGNSQQHKSHNRKRQKSAQAGTLDSLLGKIDALIECEVNQMQEVTWREQKCFLKEQRAAQKLSTLSSMLVCNTAMAQDLLERRRVCHEEGLDAAEVSRALAECQEKKKALEAQISELEFEIMNDLL